MMIDMENTLSSQEQTVITFRLDRQMYALPVESIVRIIELVPITPLPQVDKVVKGVINVHSHAVPVLDMRSLFGLPEAALHLYTPIILIQLHGQMCGLIVDEVVDVVHLAAGSIFRVTDILPCELGDAPILQGIAHIQGEMVLLLDPPHIFQAERMDELAGTLSSLPEPVATSTADEGASPSEIVVEEVQP